MKMLTLQSPAKINLSLRVLRRRPDGYHELATLFHRISLRDTLTLKKQKNFSLVSTNKKLPVDETNIITKAYRLLQKTCPKMGGVGVRLKKVIPLGAGLGGGSSNAAAFLIGANRLYRLGLTEAKLAALGGQLGADVPFFVYNIKQGIGIGRGDKIKKVKKSGKLNLILATTDAGLSTRDVYENLRKVNLARPAGRQAASLTKVSRDITMLCTFLADKRLDRIAPFLRNDLEPSAFDLRPSLRRVIEIFRKRGIPLARMTGSGPSVFGVLPNLREAKTIVRQLRRDLPNYNIRICYSY